MERIAHRGAKLELPENSAAAFRRAFERGADAVELDVHATRDDVVVVHHDPDIRLPGTLVRRAIRELDWSGVRSIQPAAGVGVPTLAEVLAETPRNKTVYVEIKGAGIASLVARAIADDGRCVVHSFDYGTIAEMSRIAPGVPRGILFERQLSDLGAVMAETRARDVWPHWTLVDRALVEEIHGRGSRVIAWTVNDPSRARSLADLGVDGICTDDVRLL